MSTNLPVIPFHQLLGEHPVGVIESQVTGVVSKLLPPVKVAGVTYQVVYLVDEAEKLTIPMIFANRERPIPASLVGKFVSVHAGADEDSGNPVDFELLDVKANPPPVEIDHGQFAKWVRVGRKASGKPVTRPPAAAANPVQQAGQPQAGSGDRGQTTPAAASAPGGTAKGPAETPPVAPPATSTTAAVAPTAAPEPPKPAEATPGGNATPSPEGIKAIVPADLRAALIERLSKLHSLGDVFILAQLESLRVKKILETQGIAMTEDKVADLASKIYISADRRGIFPVGGGYTNGSVLFPDGPQMPWSSEAIIDAHLDGLLKITPKGQK
jgi:hypothetical protein